MTFSMENPHFECALICCSIFLFELSSPVELIVLEIAFIAISFLRNIDPFAGLGSTFDRTFVTRTVLVDDFTVEEAIISE